jgi:catalase-peroxidase
MTVLVGGMRALNANVGNPSTASSRSARDADERFFVNLLDMRTKWQASPTSNDVFEGRDRATGDGQVDRHPRDLVFGSNSQLRAIAEVYALTTPSRCSCATSLAACGPKVMNLDASTCLKTLDEG